MAGRCFNFAMQKYSFSIKFCKKKAFQRLLKGFPHVRHYAYGLIVLDMPTNR